MSTRSPSDRQQAADLPPGAETDLRTQEDDSGSRSDQAEARAARHEAADSSKKRISMRLVFSSTLIALLAVLFAAVSYRTYRRPVDKPQEPLQVDKLDINSAVASLQEAAADLKRKWSLCSQTVREAFARHYSPTLGEHDALPADPLGKYMDHADSVLNRALLSGPVTEQGQDEYAIYIKLVELVYRGAVKRLSSLQDLEKRYEKRGIAVPLLGLPESVQLPSNQELVIAGGSWSFQQFLESIPNCPVHSERFISAKEEVPAVLADRLSLYLQMARDDVEFVEFLAGRFTVILNLIGIKNGLDDDNLGKLKPLYTDQHEAFFDFTSFAQFLLSKRTEGNLLTDRLFQSIASNWTTNGVRIRIQEVLDQHKHHITQNLQARRRAIQHGTEGKTIPSKYLYALAVFLI